MSKVKEFFAKIGRWFKSLVVAPSPEVEPKLKTFWNKQGTRNASSSLLAILSGVVIGFVFLLLFAIFSPAITFKSAIEAFRILIGGIFYTGRTDTGALSFGFNPQLFGDMLFRAMPLLMTGLSVAIAFKTGLFNIGASGQYLMGTWATLVVALSMDTTVVNPFFVWLLALLAGMAAGFLWGCIPGLFKAFLNVNEVITCIMTNWISINLVHWFFQADNNKGAAGAQFVNFVDNTKSGFILKTSTNGVVTPTFGMDKLFPGSQVSGGILIAIVVAIVLYIVINRTVFGYELRACGSNRHSAKYAGMNDTRSIILSMGIAGALAAAGASLYFLSGHTEYAWTNNMSLPAEGFNGIPVALLAYNNPIGTIFASMFMAYINIAGEQIRGATAYNKYISDLIVAIIIYLSAFSLLFKDILSGKIFAKKKAQEVAPATAETVAPAITEVEPQQNTEQEAGE
ncbi:MAG: ABC transporter permease [Clostridia bacterium]|nr:ABC transporter permease [Clostridia bacterium]